MSTHWLESWVVILKKKFYETYLWSILLKDDLSFNTTGVMLMISKTQIPFPKRQLPDSYKLSRIWTRRIQTSFILWLGFIYFHMQTKNLFDTSDWLSNLVHQPSILVLLNPISHSGQLTSPIWEITTPKSNDTEQKKFDSSYFIVKFQNIIINARVRSRGSKLEC